MNKWIPMMGIAFCLFSGLSEASSLDNLLIFGDSYFDTGAGNAVAQSLGTPLPSPTPPYFNGRHSNGPIWVDFTSQLLEVPNTDFAVAGAETGSQNFAIPPLGGLFQQLLRFEATLVSPTHPIPFEELVIVDGGGNDYFSLLNNPGDLNPAGVIATTLQAVQNLEVVFGTLQALGAQKIVMWNLGDMGKLPLFTDPALGLTVLSPLYSGASVAFNTALGQLVDAFNTLPANIKSKKQIFIFDANGVFNEIEALLTAQGIDISQHTITTFPNGTFAITGPQPNQVAFYDQVHPTSMVWQIFANSMAAYIDTLIQGPRFIAAQEDLAFESARFHRDVVENHYRTLHFQRYVCPTDCCCNPCDCDPCECDPCCCTPDFQFYLDGATKWGSTNSRRGCLGLYYNAQLVLLGADYKWDDCLTVGASFTAQNNCARIHKHHGKMDLTDYIPTFYAFFSMPEFFIDADLSYHFYDFRRIKRNIPFLYKHAKARHHAWGFEGNIDAGYVYQCNCLTLLPIVGLGYQDLRIDRYKERCGGFLNLEARKENQNSLIGRIGGQAFLSFCNSQLLPFAEVYYEHEFLRWRHNRHARFRRSLDNAIIYNKVSRPKLDYIRFALGVDAQIASCLTGNISYEGETTFTEYNNTLRIQFDTTF